METDILMTLYTFYTFWFFIDTVTFGGEDFIHLHDLLVPYSLGADIHLVNCDD